MTRTGTQLGKASPRWNTSLSLILKEFEDLEAIGKRFLENASDIEKEAAALVSKEAPDSSAVNDEEGDGGEADASSRLAISVTLPDVPKVVKFTKSGVGGNLTLSSHPFLDAISESVTYLRSCIPRVELFEPVDQIMDAVTLVELEKSDQEFMQGVFRYAGMWEGHETLFRQDPATTRRLERASADFTRKIHEEWKQGENLAFKFQHAGKNGDQIELMIADPAVANRAVRPSERSAGFSAFFTMSMRMLARTEANPANKYLLLFDEPGTSLHPAGQVNLQKVFERLSMKDQIVYATHSLFMINHNRPERNKVVSKDASGTKIDQKPFFEKLESS